MQLYVRHEFLREFLQSIYIISHSRGTINTYELALANRNRTGFVDFLKQKYNVDQIELAEKVKREELDAYRILKEFVIFLDVSGYGSKSVKMRYAVAKTYLRHLGIKIYNEDCKHAIRMPKVVARLEEPMTREMLLRLLRNAPPKLQTVILVAVASGMRIGEIVQLEIKDIDFEYKPTKIRIRAETTKTREERETFLTVEATNSLKDYLRRYYEWKEGEKNENLKNQVIFGRTSLRVYDRKPDEELKRGTVNSATNLLHHTLYTQIAKIPELSRNNENGRKVIHFHAFRKYFRTVVGNACGRDFAEALIGHKFYLSTYYNLSDTQKKELYLKAEPYLTISDYAKIEQTIQDLTEQCRELQAWKNGFEQYAREHGISITSVSK